MGFPNLNSLLLPDQPVSQSYSFSQGFVTCSANLLLIPAYTVPQQSAPWAASVTSLCPQLCCFEAGGIAPQHMGLQLHGQCRAWCSVNAPVHFQLYRHCVTKGLQFSGAVKGRLTGSQLHRGGEKGHTAGRKVSKANYTTKDTLLPLCNPPLYAHTQRCTHTHRHTPGFKRLNKRISSNAGNIVCSLKYWPDCFMITIPAF